jgi:short-subunit dehydrogenase
MAGQLGGETVHNARRLAVVTGASYGIGLELARLCAQNHYDLVIAADDLSLLDAAQELASSGVAVSPVICDLSTPQGVDALVNAVTASGRAADILIANAARNARERNVHHLLGDARAYIDGTIHLIDRVSRSMRGRGRGRILINLQAIYDSNKIFLDYFSAALTRELKHSGVTVTCLAPGAAGVGISADDARTGYHAMMRGAIRHDNIHAKQAH